MDSKTKSLIPHFRTRFVGALIARLVIWLVSSLSGYLAVTLLLLLWVNLFSDINPLSARELILWFDGLDGSAKASISTAVITVFGFLLAFQSGYENARKERLMSAELDAAKEIKDHYSEIEEHARQLYSYASQIVEAHVVDVGQQDQTMALAEYLHSNLAEMRGRQRRLVELSVDSHLLAGRYDYVVLRHLNLSMFLEDAARQASELSHSSHFVPNPNVLSPNMTDLQVIDRFLPHRAQAFIDAYEAWGDSIHWPLSRVVSGLRQKLSRDNLAMWINGARMFLDSDKESEKSESDQPSSG